MESIKGGEDMAHLHMRINELLEEREISKNTICKELDIPRSNFNRYCRDEFQRIDANLVCKLCEYFDCNLGDLIEFVKD
ncbi:helix-turn-helix transcriptional regulator [Clostridium sp.]